jgi:hypothetical protein
MASTFTDKRMTIRKIFVPAATSSWSKEELHQLRALAHSGTSIEAIARALKRSASAVRNKAGLHGISLAASRAGVQETTTDPALRVAEVIGT